MRCPECQHENPDSNRFCGQCGALLPVKNGKSTQTVSVSPKPRERREPEKPVAETRPRQSLREEPRPVAAHHEPEPRGVSGPSFLGIGESDFERARGEDLYGTSWGGRAGFALVILIAVGVLAYMQWRSNRPLISIFAPKPSPSQAQTNPEQPPAPGDMPAQSQANSATTPPQTNGAATSASAGTTAQNGSAPASPAASSQSQPNSDQGPASAASDNSAQKGPQEAANTGGASSGAAQSNAAAQNPSEQKQDESKKEESTKKPSDTQAASVAESSSSGDEASSAASEEKPVHAKRAAKATAKTDAEQQQVQQAEGYIDAQQCDRGVNMLQSASQEGNTQAVIKLGALYATGTCVPFDRVIAYHYFSRAFRVEPDNSSLDHNRIMLWNEMSAAERQRAMAEDGTLAQ